MLRLEPKWSAYYYPIALFDKLQGLIPRTQNNPAWVSYTGKEAHTRWDLTINCILCQQVVSCGITRLFVSLWRVWLVKLLSDWLDHSVILILDILPTIFLPIITHISTLCTYHCVCWGNILNLRICPMECKQKGRRQPHHWLCRRIPYCLRSWVLTWDTSGCERSIICDSGWPHSLHWVRCEGEGGECSRSQCPQCNHESKDWWWVDWEVIAGCVCWLRQVFPRDLPR